MFWGFRFLPVKDLPSDSRLTVWIKSFDHHLVWNYSVSPNSFTDVRWRWPNQDLIRDPYIATCKWCFSTPRRFFWSDEKKNSPSLLPLIRYQKILKKVTVTYLSTKGKYFHCHHYHQYYTVKFNCIYWSVQVENIVSLHLIQSILQLAQSTSRLELLWRSAL